MVSLHQHRRRVCAGRGFYRGRCLEDLPSENDKFPGWAKRVGELQAEAYAIEYGWKKVSIVRPANIYGPYDNFDPANSMVVPSLIRRALAGEDPLTVWGDGSPIRDFIHAEDVARGMMLAVEKGVTEPINLGSGTGRHHQGNWWTSLCHICRKNRRSFGTPPNLPATKSGSWT